MQRFAEHLRVRVAFLCGHAVVHERLGEVAHVLDGHTHRTTQNQRSEWRNHTVGKTLEGTPDTGDAGAGLGSKAVNSGRRLLQTVLELCRVGSDTECNFIRQWSAILRRYRSNSPSSRR